MANNFLSYSDAQALMAKIGQKFSALTGAYIPKGNCAFASLPATPTASMIGNVYNVTDAFTTDSRFAEGAGKAYPAGSNVVVVDNSTYATVTPAGSENPTTEGWYELDSITGKYVLSTDTTVDNSKTYYAKTTLIQYDVLAGFVDLSDIEDAIDDLAGDFADEFDDATAYAEGDIVIYENKLYQFNTAHAAGAWTGSDVTAVTVKDLLDATLVKANTNISAAKATVESLITDEFAAANAYSIGDVVTREDGLYKFKVAHTAGDPWSASEVDAVQVSELIEDAEPESLTPAQIADLEGLLD